MLSRAPWILRITEHASKPVPVMVVKQRLEPKKGEARNTVPVSQRKLQERGLLYGAAQRRCLAILKTILARVQDSEGIPLELHRYLQGSRIDLRGNLPLDEEAGCKLGLIFKLHERIKEMNRVELLARRIDLFTREEAAYWHSRITNFSGAANRWAVTGLKLMLAGQPGDPAIEKMLEETRSSVNRD